MTILELIEKNNNMVSRKNLSDIFGTKIGPDLYNLGFNALGEDEVCKKEILVQLTAKMATNTKVVIEFTALIKFLGRVIAAPQNTYLQSIKSHEMWATRKQYLLDKLADKGLIKQVGILRVAIDEAEKDAEG